MCVYRQAVIHRVNTLLIQLRIIKPQLTLFVFVSLQELTEEAVSETVSIKEEQEVTMDVEKVKEAVVTRVVTDSQCGVVAVALPPSDLPNTEKNDLARINTHPIKVAFYNLLSVFIASSCLCFRF